MDKSVELFKKDFPNEPFTLVPRLAGKEYPCSFILRNNTVLLKHDAGGSWSVYLLEDNSVYSELVVVGTTPRSALERASKKLLAEATSLGWKERFSRVRYQLIDSMLEVPKNCYVCGAGICIHLTPVKAVTEDEVEKKEPPPETPDGLLSYLTEPSKWHNYLDGRPFVPMRGPASWGDWYGMLRNSKDDVLMWGTYQAGTAPSFEKAPVVQVSCSTDYIKQLIHFGWGPIFLTTTVEPVASEEPAAESAKGVVLRLNEELRTAEGAAAQLRNVPCPRDKLAEEVTAAEDQELAKRYKQWIARLGPLVMQGTEQDVIPHVLLQRIVGDSKQYGVLLRGKYGTRWAECHRDVSLQGLQSLYVNRASTSMFSLCNLYNAGWGVDYMVML